MSEANMILSTAKAQAEAIGVCAWTIFAMRKAGRVLGDPIGRFTTRAWLMNWLRRHPEFVASHYLGRTSKLPRKASGQPPAVAGICDEPSDQRDPHMP
jgi:hypothetical protein